MGMRSKRNPLNLTPEQMGRMGDQDLFLDTLNEDLMQSPLSSEEQPIPEEEITLPEEPVTSEEQMSQDIPEPPLALQTQMPATPSREPGKTTAVQALEGEKKPEIDETEQLFTEYGKRRGEAEKELAEFEAGAESRSAERRKMIGLSGILKSFGESLADITGSSAKPFQTSAETIARMGEEQAAGEERKAKSLRERILQAREPLEQKAEEIKFRDVFEKRQLTKALSDPNSKQSAQARDLANSFLDTYIASISSRAGEDEIAKVEGIRPKLEKMSASQIQEFLKNLQSLKFTESKAELEAAKAEGKQAESETKREQKLMDVADKEFSADAKKMNETVGGLRRFQTQVDGFRKDIDLALAGDEAAAKRIQQNEGVVAYLVARQNEPKGVFTDNDFRALNQLGRGRTWFEQFQNWTSQGLNAVPTQTALTTMKNVLDQLEFIKQDPKDIVKSYQKVYKLSNNPFKQEYANKFEEVIGEEPTQPQTAQPQTVQPQTMSFPDIESAKAAKKAGQIKSGDVIIVNGKQQRVK